MSQGDHVELAIAQPLIGVDTGDVRVGLALKPADSIHAEPLAVVPADTKLMARIDELARKHKADTVVVGLPRDIHGRDTAQTRKAREFAGELADVTGLHVLLHDEFGTSERARKMLGAVTRDKAHQKLDAIAAALLLEDYMRSMV